MIKASDLIGLIEKTPILDESYRDVYFHFTSRIDFKPYNMMHVGTLKASKMRWKYSTKGKSKAYVHMFKLKPGKIIESWDFYKDDLNDTFENLMNFLIDEPGGPRMRFGPAYSSIVAGSGTDRMNRLGNWLTSQGVSALSYMNTHEDVRSMSYCVTTPAYLEHLRSFENPNKFKVTI